MTTMPLRHHREHPGTGVRVPTPHGTRANRISIRIENGWLKIAGSRRSLTFAIPPHA